MKNHLLTLLLCSCCMLIIASNDDSSFRDSPCQTSLGFRHGIHPSPLEFHVMTSTGDSDDVRLNSPMGWSPAGQLKDHFIQIKTATPVLLTGILLQGGVGRQGRVTSGILHLSLDCVTYTSQNVSTTGTSNPESIVSVRLTTMAFVRCIRLVPNGSLGHTPGLRLDLLGCVVGKQSPCGNSSKEDVEDTPQPPRSPEVLYQTTNPFNLLSDNHIATTSTSSNVDFQKQTTDIDGDKKTTMTNNNKDNDKNRKEQNNSPLKNEFKPDKILKESTATISKTVLSEDDFYLDKTPTSQPNQAFATSSQLSDEFDKEEAKPENGTSSHSFSDPSNNNENSGNEDIEMKNGTATVLYNEQFVDSSEVESSVERKRENLTEIMKNIGMNKLGCGTKRWSNPRSRHKRVVQGRQNMPFEWPWLVSLHFLLDTNFTKLSGFNHFCGASLIAPDWVISVAHCFSEFVSPDLANLSNWEVYIGLHDQAYKKDSSVQVRNISMVITRANYDIMSSGYKGDISLIKLDRPVVWTSNVSPICVDDTDLFYHRGMCYVTGWGQRNFFNSTGTRFPYVASLSIMTTSDCKARYDDLVTQDHEFSSMVYVDDPIVCAYGHAGEDACHGDSGGPLMCLVEDRWTLTGIVSGGYECGVEHFPGFYVRVSYYYDWILRQMALYGD